ncbi:MAG: nitrogenase molybdenum-iron protein subunit beta [Pseudodesulfovibrio sp.]|uniref:Nitrogenase molybdenum-iron protein beta chain n=1 Tax=Pseudodesulfovibrio aespoeensis (strain ATCC 700646 / DSM 10631 / Aspo-2) TaxID=643562 RepID=E6VSQ6_PSEA9|nr:MULTISPECIES: nitrogenase molybdenum-iron protein subunit beta [Pseudodesulfovibrio]MBU4193190.1 nitrogenase molybdenum-iron protein subunit beta [Pseudomonadota bacterium]ADU62041.1 nitrogenase molybdenum-iron protein beta chain [Pseudodesulfovibrio aespoeensis Aspo-2]MBU4244686.1 nitrogenase molybdenum-iron protein subunit beta [Pseudomonadota bacterium]MBU4474684.1 nitrogenase molybdenum-iron protein subunit beta [Pseudomonadota bacterium]MBU4515989.1 nitrogenase molybdenum-iron protein 
MLLRHTPTEVADRKALTINPAKTCQPIGAMYAALGIHGCLPHSHGSQGCCAYHRSALTRHYKEPVSAATSSFTEGASVFGGQANLLQAINNIFTVYEPEVIAVHTTCLSETIGDDLNQIFDKARREGKVPEGCTLVGAPTPSYVGSHVTGFSNMVKAMAQLAEPSGKKSGKVNIIPGWVEPSDMAEIKRLAALVGVPVTVFPDTSGVLDAPLTGEYKMFPDGGVTIKELKASGDATATLAMGEWCSADAARWLDAKCKVPCTVLDMPFGLAATDRFIDVLRTVAGVTVPDAVAVERGQLVDLISDMHQYFYGKRVALWGDPDQLISMCEFLVSLDMQPAYVVTGTPGKKFEERIRDICAGRPFEVKVKAKGDMFLMHQWIKNEPVDLLIGNSYGKYIARDEDIPLLRWGFPILDRQGHQYFPTVGYRGGLRLLEKMLDLFLDRKDRDDPETSFELVL